MVCTEVKAECSWRGLVIGCDDVFTGILARGFVVFLKKCFFAGRVTCFV